jgi:hypothetical protein
MHSIKLVNRESGALRRRLQEIRSDVDPRSRKMDRLRGRIAAIRREDNINMLTHYGSGTYAGEDRFGRDLAPPAESTLRSREGPLHGFVLAPHGLASRMITQFYTRWDFSGGHWRMTDGWKGIPWVIYHLQGCRKGSNPERPNWSLPKRDVGGPSLKCAAQWRREFAEFRARLLRSG